MDLELTFSSSIPSKFYSSTLACFFRHYWMNFHLQKYFLYLMTKICGQILYSLFSINVIKYDLYNSAISAQFYIVEAVLYLNVVVRCCAL